MAAYDDLNVGRIAVAGVISVAVLAVTALALQVLFYAMMGRVEAAKSAQSDYRRQNATLAEQKEEIEKYGVDADTGKVTIPIDVAIQNVIKQAKGDHADNQVHTDDA